MSENKKRKLLLDQFSSQYLRPSKYLLMYRNNDLEEESEDQANNKHAIYENNDNNGSNDEATIKRMELASSASEERVGATTLENRSSNGKSIMEIGNDCFFEILGFLELYEFRSCILVSKTWARLIIPFFMDLAMEIYENDEHLDSLRKFGQENDDLILKDGLYTEGATWKPFTCYNDDQIGDFSVSYGHCSDDDDVIELDECEFHRKLIPFGSPLCKGTVKEQFELVQDKIDSESYRILIEKQLGIPEKEQDTYEFNPFVIFDEIEREKGMIEPYLHEIQEAKCRDNDDDNFNVFSEEHVPYAIRAGITRCTKRAGLYLNHFLF